MTLNEMFDAGNRKTTVTLIALIASIIVEKYGGGLGDLREVILSILAIFTGGNVLSKGIYAAKEVKLAKYNGGTVVDVPVEDLASKPTPQQQEAEPGTSAIIQNIIEHINKLDNAAGTEIKALKEADVQIQQSIKDLSDRVDVQVKNLSQVLTIINGMRNATQPAQP